MSNESYEKALENARAEMTELLRKRAHLDSRLTQLKSTIDVLSSLVNEPPKLGAEISAEMLDDMGISEAIRRVLRESQVALTPNQIKNKLSDFGFDLAQYSNSGAVIYNTLKRLERQKEITPVNDSSGTIAYTVTPSYADELGPLSPVPVYGSPNSSASQDARRKAVTGAMTRPPEPPKRRTP